MLKACKLLGDTAIWYNNDYKSNNYYPHCVTLLLNFTENSTAQSLALGTTRWRRLATTCGY
jgi:hypothetical protein